MKSFISIARHVKVVIDDETTFLIDNRTGKEFQLNSEQVDLIKNLNGTKNLDEIIEVYSEQDRGTLLSFINSLKSCGLIEINNVGIERLADPAIISPYLSGILFDITSICNLQCEHCYVGDYHLEGKGKDLSFDEIEKILDELASMNIRDISITGGEPMLCPDIKEIILGIIKRNIRLASFFTNGVGMTKEFANFLANLPQKIRVYISLDGANNNSHGIIRGNDIATKDYFSATVDAIRILRERKVSVTVNTCVHDDNIKELPAMYEMLKKLGVNYWRLAVPKPIGRFKQIYERKKPNWDRILMSYRDVLLKHLEDIKINGELFSAPLKIEIEMLFQTEMVVKPIRLYSQDDVACTYHRNRCSIKSNGDIITCGYFDYLVSGNVREESFKNIWLSSSMQQIKQMKIGEISGCLECEYLKFCGTGCRAIAHRLTGDIFSKDEYACSLVIPFHRKILPELLKKFNFSLKTTDKKSSYYVS